MACRTPTPGRHGETRIPGWKFDTVRGAILDVLADGPVPFGKLTQRVRELLDGESLARLGSVGWHVTAVKLELEVRGEIRRQDGSGPQILELCG